MVLTVTLFGGHDALDQAISDELERRGCRTHTVRVESGWLQSATNAVLRLDSAAGASALRGLNASDAPGVHLVATCAESPETLESTRLRHMCEQCGTNHDVALIRHEPIAQTPDSGEPDAATPLHDLAVAVVDEVTDQVGGSTEPSFSLRAV